MADSRYAPPNRITRDSLRLVRVVNGGTSRFSVLPILLMMNKYIATDIDTISNDTTWVTMARDTPIHISPMI